MRELHWDAVSRQLVSSPVQEYARLHNGTYHSGAATIPAGTDIPVQAGDGGTVDLMVSFKLSAARGRHHFLFSSDSIAVD